MITLKQDLMFKKNLKLSRIFRSITSLGKPKGRIVILGSGWGGYKVLSGLDTKYHEVIVVSPRNHFVFTPLLASTAVGTLEFRAITEPVRRFRDKGITYYSSWCDKIDLNKKEVTCTTALVSKNETFKISFDKLIIAVGAYANTFNIPGVAENSYFLKEISEPNTSEQETINALNFAVVGGGPTGIEFSSELYDFVKEDLSRLYPNLMSKVQITVYDVADTILGGFQKELQEYTSKKFFREGIKIKTKTVIAKVEKNHLILKDGLCVPYGLLVWATGITATPLVRTLDLMEDKASRIITNNMLQVLDQNGKVLDNVFALGDCAAIKDNPLPATAQVGIKSSRRKIDNNIL
ncbi:hypothetical protein HK099_005395 [Clydaea vesicula]|uniref:FAD/NAD(P)-binding domain-containing protein n=1 Tax=Clydaea vesicula TaxID=447962 RepID=A0AAD5XZM0_9FUNG|nr:hypothetical protein HK099_005395 [Clydaea vesicula]